MTKRRSNEQFIAEATSRHQSYFDYSLTAYKGSYEPVTVICPVHGAFQQRACSHLLYGCRLCGLQSSAEKRKTKPDGFIDRANKIHDFRYDYTQIVSLRRQHQKIQIRCLKHGIFEQYANDHLKGHGCKKCSYEMDPRKGVPAFNTEKFITRCNSLHDNQYDYSSTIYRGHSESITVRCKKHGLFTLKAADHSRRGIGCVKCHKIEMLQSGKKRNAVPVDFTEFQARADIIHENKFDYVFYTRLVDDVGIMCPTHGLFVQTASDHLYSAAGCPQCARQSTSENLRYSITEFKDLLAVKWDNKVLLAGSYKDLQTRTSFHCEVHGDFAARPASLLTNRHACPECRKNSRGTAIRLSQEQFELRASQTHNNKYSYGIYNGSGNKIDIVCPKHGLFSQLAGNHLCGMGCPPCGTRKHVMQNQWLDVMNVTDREVWLPVNGGMRICADGYDTTTNTIYEFWGDFWHGNPKVYSPTDFNSVTGMTFAQLYEKTLNKRRLISESGYHLVEIWEQDWRRIDEQASQGSFCSKEPAKIHS